MKLDLRITPFRRGIAAAHLKGVVEAQTYNEGKTVQIVVPELAIRSEPMITSGMESQALKGQIATCYGEENGFSLIQMQDDEYVGWVITQGISEKFTSTTHKITALKTYIYSDESIKSLPLAALTQGTSITIAHVGEKFSRLFDGSYVFTPHIAPISAHATDWVQSALLYLNCPYLWGGKTSSGLDCSALVQLALATQGIKAPRDSDQQEAALGQEVAIQSGHMPKVQKGDLLFWKGHVAICLDENTILHANAHHMSVQKEPLLEALKRIDASGTALKSIKRLA